MRRASALLSRLCPHPAVPWLLYKPAAGLQKLWPPIREPRRDGICFCIQCSAPVLVPQAFGRLQISPSLAPHARLTALALGNPLLLCSAAVVPLWDSPAQSSFLCTCNAADELGLGKAAHCTGAGCIGPQLMNVSCAEALMQHDRQALAGTPPQHMLCKGEHH